MPVGYISYFNSIGNYGFIDSHDLLLDHIFFHSTSCKKSYKHIYKGDKINFDLDINDENGNEAKNISFIKNASLDGLRIDYKNNATLKGFLKKIDDKYYVKDIDTYIFIRIIIANYEINLEEVYEDNLNKLIEYKIIILTDKNKIRAININRQFLPECKLLVEGNQTEGLLLDKVKGGYQIKIYDNILGFLPNSFALKSTRILKCGEIINVTCTKAGDNLENVLFNLTENIENDEKFIIEKEKFISSLKSGDKFFGKILIAKGFGLFIGNEFCEGLLHVNKILNDSDNLSKQSKQFSKLMKQAFSKGQELEVIVDENINNRITFIWDNSIEPNKKLFQDFYSKFLLLDLNRI